MGILTTVESGGTNLLLKYGIIVAIGFSGGWTVNSWRLNSALSDLKLADSKAASVILQKQIDNDTRIATQYQSAAASSQKQYEDSQHALNTLNANLSAGRIGLRVSAVCDNPSATTSRDTGTAATDQASTGQADNANLVASAQPIYVDLVSLIQQHEAREAELTAIVKADHNLP